MSDTTTVIERDKTTGRFLPGNAGNGGRKPGQRNKLGEAFLEDLREAWNEHGTTALAQCAKEHPDQFCRIVAGLLPRDVNLNIEVDATGFALKFRQAVELLGNEPPPRRQMKVIGNGRR